jgi:hypothetical protein
MLPTSVDPAYGYCLPRQPPFYVGTSYMTLLRPVLALGSHLASLPDRVHRPSIISGRQETSAVTRVCIDDGHHRAASGPVTDQKPLQEEAVTMIDEDEQRLPGDSAPPGNTCCFKARRPATRPGRVLPGAKWPPRPASRRQSDKYLAATHYDWNRRDGSAEMDLRNRR